jgi:hypothetical protein
MIAQATLPQAREIRLLPVAEIRIKDDRLRPVDTLFAKGIADHLLSPNSEPLPPIEVYQEPGKKGWVVADGAHRLTGYQLAKIENIEAIQIGNSEVSYRSVELQRTLFNKALDPFERAQHLAELYYIERRKQGIADDEDPRKFAGLATKASIDAKKGARDIVSRAVSLTGAVGQSVGLNKRQVQRDLMLFRMLSPHALQRLRNFKHPILANASQLMMIAKEPGDTQFKIAQLLTIPKDHPTDVPAKSVRDARSRLGLQVPTSSGALRKSENHQATFLMVLSNLERGDLIGALTGAGIPTENADKIALYCKKLLKGSAV